ncbi:GGDEF domain-containing protein [Franzmannia qiaohouensis]|uniref:diguanylate cyclase n=1 Tax=Franzmannia qiaohouensis TaxID=1329370 RepID=A0ABU1HGR8_9GAMM|nr:GGDEF domain-containing protein [Halomonas qiaohouensis]MDR5906678.1 GGDEF domain-containing protein [Halomonas qiaohouensis]
MPVSLSTLPSVAKFTPWAEFDDPTLESRYRRSTLARDACQMQHAALLAAALFLLFGFADHAQVGTGRAFAWLLLMRFTVAASCILLAIALRRQPRLAHRRLPINLICLITISGLLLTIPLRSNAFSTHLTSVLVVSMALYLLVPNRLPWTLAWNAYLIAGFTAAVLLWMPAPVGVLTSNLLLLGVVNLVGGITQLRLNRLQRLQYLSLQEERDTNRRLQAEIEERCQLERQLRHSASTDHLTGLYNRRRFFELAERELCRACRNGTPLALFMIDIDHFKKLNDSYGHRIGDQALIAVASGCQAALRDTDIIGRYGGEEFIVALPDATLNTAITIAERLRQQVNDIALSIEPAPPTLSVTLGISLLYADETTLDGALQRADQALYAGKARGRNQVVVAPPGTLTAVEA